MSRLFDAAHRNDAGTLRTLLEGGEALTASDSRGWTALHYAADGGALETTQLLLERGANPDTLDRFGNTALFRAVYERHPEVVKLLRARGADPLLGAAQLARMMGGPIAECFADLPAELPPAPKRDAEVMTSGRIPDGPPNARWQPEHERLWKLLVPPRGEAPTLQGELIRCTGKLADEAYSNGNINWGPRFETMCRFLGDRLADKTVFTAEEVLSLREAIGLIRREHDTPDVSGAGSTYYRLSEAAVRFCHARPELVPWAPEPEPVKQPQVRKRRT
jgi:hypothetical protein